MTQRSVAAWSQRNRALVLVALGLTISAAGLAGCDPRQAMYFLQPFEAKIPPKCPTLKDKRVVIVTSTAAALRSDFTNIDREITKKLGAIIKENVKKVDVVDFDKVAKWSENKPTWTDPSEAAEAFEADVVIALEVREFQIQDPSSPGLFQGRSDIGIEVVEMVYPEDDKGKPMTDQPREPKTIYSDDAASVYPRTSHIPVEASINTAVFKNRFLEIVVKELSWAFVEHARGDDIHDTRFTD